MKKMVLMKMIIPALICGMMFTSCDSNKAENLLVGKWVTSDYHAGDNDTIVFNNNFWVEQYFDYFLFRLEYPAFIIYSLSDNKIVFDIALSSRPPEIVQIITVQETFEYVLQGNSLTIKGFSNPFSFTDEVRTDVRFTKVK